MEAFLPIAILFIFAICVGAGIYILTNILGPKNPLASKLSVYECGVKPEGTARTPFKLHFYLIAVLFLLFDVEGAFFFPWALIYRESLKTDGTLLMVMVVYLGLMALALLYVFKKDALRLKE